MINGLQENLAMTLLATVVLHGLGAAILPAGRWKYAVVPAAMLILWIPFGKHSLAACLLSVYPAHSVGAITLYLVALAHLWFHRSILTVGQLASLCAWNLLFGALVNLSALGYLDVDLYRDGYAYSWLFLATGLMAIALYLRQNPLAYLFTAYMACFVLGTSRSANLCDIIIDPGAMVWSLVILAVLAAKRVGRGRRQPVPDGTDGLPDADDRLNSQPQ